ncbi:MAG: FAD-binding domain-containing protein [Actinomycetota bacterium]
MAQLPHLSSTRSTPTRSTVETWVDEHLGHLIDGPAVGSPSIRGGQRAADAALASFDVRGYAAHRNEVAPIERRGASRLSPYIRHGLLSLAEVWAAVGGGPARDVAKFRDELLWQEYSRHWYARLGRATARPVRNTVDDSRPGDGWDRMLPCLNAVVGELETEGWLVNQTRMWLASDWTVRHRQDWRRGEDRFFRHLLDGSRAANRLGWQWTTGVGSNKPYGFSRWQVEKRAPGLCRRCPHRNACPIDGWPDEPAYTPVEWPTEVDLTGPDEIVTNAMPEQVWLTAESLGERDPALLLNPGLPVVFVFDEPLLRRLRLDGKRLVFLAETLAELGEYRALELRLGDPTIELAGRQLAVTHAPVPGFADRATVIAPAEIHPWPWLRAPRPGSVRSFSAWRKKVDRR